MDNLTIDTTSNMDESEYESEMNKKCFTYLIEQQTNKITTNADIMNNNVNIYGSGILNILCYHVTTKGKYPFIQFMLDKLPFLNNIINEMLILPFITISNDTTEDFSDIIINKIKQNILALGCDSSKITENAFKGLIRDSKERVYALVNISDVDIFRIAITRNTPAWFVLPTEIINNKSVCNIPIDGDVTDLFSNIPELGALSKLDSSNPFSKPDFFPIPDAVYSGSYLKMAEFRSVFSMSREKVYSSCGEYYYFFRLFEDAVKEGGWVRQGGYKTIDLNDIKITHNPAGTKLIDNEYGRFIKGGINRYALFPENYIIHNELSKSFSLTDDDINTTFGKNGCIVIQYEDDDLDTLLPDILAKEYESAFPISYHVLNKSILGDKYEIDKQNKYTII